MTKKVDTWMPLLVDRYLGDTTHLSTEQHGAYLLLLLTMWKRDGSLPNKDAQLAAIARMSPSRWKANKDVLMEFFAVDGEAITQKRLTAELAHSKKITDVKSKAGTEGAKKRWQNDNENDGKPIAHAITNGVADGMANESHSACHPDASPSPPSPTESINTSGTTYPHPPAVRLNGSAAAGLPKPECPPDCPHRRIRDLWAELMPELQQPAKWSEARAAALRSRWREEATEHHWASEEDGIRFFAKLFRWCRKSDFLMGRTSPTNGHAAFALSVPWLIKAENWAKVQEGNYHTES